MNKCPTCDRIIRQKKEVDEDKKAEMKLKREENAEKRRKLKKLKLKIKNFDGDKNSMEYRKLLEKLLSYV